MLGDEMSRFKISSTTRQSCRFIGTPDTWDSRVLKGQNQMYLGNAFLIRIGTNRTTKNEGKQGKT